MFVLVCPVVSRYNPARFANFGFAGISSQDRLTRCPCILVCFLGKKGTDVSQQDTDFMKMLVMVVGALFAFMIVIIIAANAIVGMDKSDKNKDPMVVSATNERIKPVAEVNIGAAPVASASAGAADGKGTYTAACFACHGTGAAGAPKFGDKGAWKNRIAQGMSTLFDHALKGFKGMPPKGGRGDLGDDAVKAAVKYMVDGSK